ncbi:hypothetical protein [Actinoplanes solisilvae]|uniref:hypothetical protein n=1 Tax=Actinoplanes solisilvae TaxID=2486853 RepID=UPI0032C4A067
MLTESTVKKHVGRVLFKIGARDRIQSGDLRVRQRPGPPSLTGGRARLFRAQGLADTLSHLSTGRYLIRPPGWTEVRSSWSCWAATPSAKR